MYEDKWKEFVDDPRINDVEGIEPQETLEPRLWFSGARFNPRVRKRLIKIAKDFMSNLELGDVELIDIVLTGSLANYNWSSFSDIDLHIVIRYRDVDENSELVREFFNAQRANWNDKHEIEIYGYEVEIYVEDMNEPHVSTGIYSLMEDEWIINPSREDVRVDWANVYRKVSSLMDEIDQIYTFFQEEEYKKAFNRATRIKEKIRRFRHCGLAEAGVYSPENVAFKILRRTEYLSKLSSIRITSYDRMMSLKNRHGDSGQEPSYQKWQQYLMERK